MKGSKLSGALGWPDKHDMIDPFTVSKDLKLVTHLRDRGLTGEAIRKLFWDNFDQNVQTVELMADIAETEGITISEIKWAVDPEGFFPSPDRFIKNPNTRCAYNQAIDALETFCMSDLSEPEQEIVKKDISRLKKSKLLLTEKKGRELIGIGMTTRKMVARQVYKIVNLIKADSNIPEKRIHALVAEMFNKFYGGTDYFTQDKVKKLCDEVFQKSNIPV